MSTTYSLFGLALRSDLPLPCPALGERSGPADIELVEWANHPLDQLCTGPFSVVDEDAFWKCVLYDGGAAHVTWKDHFDFVVSEDGTRVSFQRLVDVSDEVLATYLLGQVLSFCLVARGIEPLHATSVLLDDAAVAFVGDSGYGKSTLAATLLDRGCRLLTDDVLVVSFVDGRAMAYPSLPRIKLTPESADAVFGGRRSLPMNRFTSKMIFPVGADDHAARPIPLRSIYLLPDQGEAEGVTIRSLPRREEFLSVIRNTFNNSVLHPARLRQQFTFARQLVSAVAVRELLYPKQLGVLPAVADAVIADVQGIAAA